MSSDVSPINVVTPDMDGWIFPLPDRFGRGDDRLWVVEPAEWYGVDLRTLRDMRKITDASRAIIKDATREWFILAVDEAEAWEAGWWAPPPSVGDASDAVDSSKATMPPVARTPEGDER